METLLRLNHGRNHLQYLSLSKILRLPVLQQWVEDQPQYHQISELLRGNELSALANTLLGVTSELRSLSLNHSLTRTVHLLIDGGQAIGDRALSTLWNLLSAMRKKRLR
jgi:hypothetical protein